MAIEAVPGSGDGADPLAKPPPSRASLLAKKKGHSKAKYKLTGVVRAVDPATRVVTIRHDAIPGFMDAMTMPFTIKDQSDLEDVRQGDEVEGSLTVEKENGEVARYELTGLVVARPAPPPKLTLGTGPDGEPTLTKVPDRLAPGDAVPDFAVTTQDGQTLRLSDLKGKVVALTFIYTRCPLPDFCPAVDNKFAELADRIGAVPARAEKVRLLSVSFDPEHDTPEVLRKHATVRGAKPPLWTFAVASHAELAKVAAPLGLTYGPTKDEIVHSLSAAVIGPDGRLVRLEAGTEGRTWKPADLLKTIYSCIATPNQ